MCVSVAQEVRPGNGLCSSPVPFQWASVKHFSSVILVMHICAELIEQHSVYCFELCLDQDGSYNSLFLCVLCIRLW